MNAGPHSGQQLDGRFRLEMTTLRTAVAKATRLRTRAVDFAGEAAGARPAGLSGVFAVHAMRLKWPSNFIRPNSRSYTGSPSYSKIHSPGAF